MALTVVSGVRRVRAANAAKVARLLIIERPKTQQGEGLVAVRIVRPLPRTRAV
jgi:hypothetical protein